MDNATSPNRKPKQVIVAGAGIAGLCCAWELMERGHAVTVLEGSDRTGGHVFTMRDPLPDGLYADMGAEHFTRPGYELYWSYVRKFGLPYEEFPRRRNMLHSIDGKVYTNAMLRDLNVLQQLGFNAREVDFLSQHEWWELPMLYFGSYLDAFTDEYQPFGVGLDDLDQISVNDLLTREGASRMAIRCTGSDVELRGVGKAEESALYRLWQTAIVKLRGVPLFPTELFRLRGGNRGMPDAFATRLGDRVRLNCPIVGIDHDETSVTVRYQEGGQSKSLKADYLVNCIPLTVLRKIPVSPSWPAGKAHVINEVTYTTQSRAVFLTHSRFWEKDGSSGNRRLESDLLWTCPIAQEVPSNRGLLMAGAANEVTEARALAAFQADIPGSAGQVERAFVKVWTDDKWAPSCERLPPPVGELAKFWPTIMQPVGRIHFAGAYADNLIWGMEAATRSANRVAAAIDAA